MHSHNQSQNFRKAAHKKIWSDNGVQISKGNFFYIVVWFHVVYGCEAGWI